MDKKTAALLVTVLLCVFSSLAIGQIGAPKPPSAMVYLPVAVAGPKNAPVGGLKKDNFVLLEDNIEQTVVTFYEPNSRIDVDIILALNALQKGRADQNSIKVREAVENFRQLGNSQNRYNIEEMSHGPNGVYDAISRHINRLVDTSIAPRKALVVITDGFESSGGEPVKALQEYARRFDVPIFILFAVDASSSGGGPSDNILAIGRGGDGGGYEDLTKWTGGSLHQGDIDTQLIPLMEGLAKHFKNQYVLGFRSTNDARDDKWRKLEVKIKAPEPVGGVAEKDMKVQVRDRYFVSKPK